MMCQCMFISCNKCTTVARDVGNGEAMHVREQNVYEKSLTLNFVVTVKLL